MVWSEVIEEVKNSEVFSIMADEMKDILKKKNRCLSFSDTIIIGLSSKVFSILNLHR